MVAPTTQQPVARWLQTVGLLRMAPVSPLASIVQAERDARQIRSMFKVNKRVWRVERHSSTTPESCRPSPSRLSCTFRDLRGSA